MLICARAQANKSYAPKHLLPPFNARTVAGTLGVLGGKVDATAHAAARVRHDAQAALENGSHHSYARAVPEEAAIVNVL